MITFKKFNKTKLLAWGSIMANFQIKGKMFSFWEHGNRDIKEDSFVAMILRWEKMIFGVSQGNTSCLDLLIMEENK